MAIVPALGGKILAAATSEIEAASLRLGKVNAAGRVGDKVTAQFPLPKSEVELNSFVSVTIGDKGTMVPSVVSLDPESAAKVLSSRNLLLGTQHYRLRSLRGMYVIDSQYTRPGSIVRPQTRIAVDVEPETGVLAFMVVALAGGAMFVAWILTVPVPPTPTPTPGPTPAPAPLPIFVLEPIIDPGRSEVALDAISPDALNNWHHDNPAFSIDTDQNESDTTISLIGEPAIKTVDREVV
jgi:hypothetical protein